MKRLIAIFFAVIVMAAAFVGCNPSTNDTSSTVDTSSTEDTSSVEDTVSTETVDPQAKLDAILAEIKTTYGENYIPSMPLDVDMFSEFYLIDKANVEALVAEMPMMSAHIDRFIGVKAVEGKVEEVKQAIELFNDNNIKNALQYPQNEARAKAAKIIVHGDYVFYVILGAYPAVDAELDEAAALEFAEAEVKKAVDIINAAF